jgi:hypothetical protein
VTLDLDTILVLNHRSSTAYDNKVSGYWLRRLDKTRRYEKTLDNVGKLVRAMVGAN